MEKNTALGGNTLWYKDAIIYEVHIKAFYDSNGDGIGDLKGLLQKLDYLEDLGVTAIWLLPFYPSPLRDDGYDIADYYNINPSYGNVKTLKKFIKEAHNRGLKVITELVINHTSDQHPWFQRARNSAPGSDHRDYYVWTDDPKKYQEARIIFTDTEPSNWSWDPVAKAYFWHRFFSHQPDLNFDNINVQQEVFKIMDYWCGLGVDGFRLDAVPYLFERENTNCENLPETHAFLKKLRAHIDSKYDDKLLLAEANMWPEDSAAYFGEGDECHMNYHFPIMPRMFMAVKMEDRFPIIDIIDQTPDIPETCQWAIFLRNHDELTLEMVTDEERDYMYKVYTKDPQAKINVGIRHRLAPLLENNRNKIELMNVLLFSLPGTPVLYYGDEIGMGDNFYLGDRDGVRTPMQWSADRNAGFSNANPQKLYLPTIIDPEYKYESVNVETQQMNGSSLLWWMKRMMAMRKRFKAFGRGDIQFLSPSNGKIIAYTRNYEDENILVLGNLSRFSQPAEIELDGYEDFIPVEVFSHTKFPKIKKEPYLFTMAPHGYYWFSLEKEKSTADTRKIPKITMKSWSAVREKRNRKILENKVLPAYLTRQSWFSGKTRTLQSLSIKSSLEIPVKDWPSTLFIIEITFNEGIPELYQIPLTFVPNTSEVELAKIPEIGILANMTLGDVEGILCDSVYTESFRERVFMNLIKDKKVNGVDGQLIFNNRIDQPAVASEDLTSKVLDNEQSNTSLIFNNHFQFKLYRKLDYTVNPDLEVIRFFSEKANFNNVPELRGSMKYKSKDEKEVMLGMMQELPPNQGNVWENIKDSLNRYFEKVLIHDKELRPEIGKADLTQPMDYQEIPESMQELLGIALTERITLLGERSAEMHKALCANPSEKDFDQEPFSLHYQRSLFSALQGLTRNAFDNLKKNMAQLPDELKPEAKEVLGMKSEVLECFKRIFAHKIDTLKIRTHGDFHLKQVLWTGKDFVITNFEGEPERPFSERRLKRSPLRDVAGMIRSFHYAAYTVLAENEFDQNKKESGLEDWTYAWFYYITRLYLNGYRDQLDHANLLPENTRDYTVLLDTFLLEKAVYELNYEMNNRPERVRIPLLGIKSIIERFRESKV